MWKLDYIRKAECWRIDAFELCCWRRLFESPLDIMEIQLLHPKGSQSRIFIGRTDAEAPILWPLDTKNWLIWKDPDAAKDEDRKRRGWQRMKWLDGVTNSMDMSLNKLGVGDGKGSLVYCSPWGCQESHTTEWLNWTNLIEESWKRLEGGERVRWKYFCSCNAGDLGSIRWLGRFPGEGNGNPL